ncbi:hypothetical protein GCM10010116_57450 [Microbispora rosea subsp. aerata]|nr:hypothetical protein GCM10010116_57450 [Microbispora rosea subsp. aerata]GLJ85221.1 hypothetical protein GCM10017588_39490 [Microbispora rosea subsp. aerata]
MVPAPVLIAWVSTRVLVRLSAVTVPVARVPVMPVPVMLVRASRVSMRVRVALVPVVAVPGRRGRWWRRCVRRRGSWP